MILIKVKVVCEPTLFLAQIAQSEAQPCHKICVMTMLWS